MMSKKNSETLAASSPADKPQLSPLRTSVRIPVLESEALFAGKQEIGIMHEGALYRLKITRQGKLILNK